MEVPTTGFQCQMVVSWSEVIKGYLSGASVCVGHCLFAMLSRSSVVYAVHLLAVQH